MKNETSSSSDPRAGTNAAPTPDAGQPSTDFAGWMSLAGVLFAAAGAGGFDWRAGALTLGLMLWIDVRWS